MLFSYRLSSRHSFMIHCYQSYVLINIEAFKLLSDKKKEFKILFKVIIKHYTQTIAFPPECSFNVKYTILKRKLHVQYYRLYSPPRLNRQNPEGILSIVTTNLNWKNAAEQSINLYRPAAAAELYWKNTKWNTSKEVAKFWFTSFSPSAVLMIMLSYYFCSFYLIIILLLISSKIIITHTHTCFC